MRFTLEIELGNDAMTERPDVADALETVARDIEEDGEAEAGTIIDANGNTVGHWRFTEGEADHG